MVASAWYMVSFKNLCTHCTSVEAKLPTFIWTIIKRHISSKIIWLTAITMLIKNSSTPQKLSLFTHTLVGQNLLLLYSLWNTKINFLEEYFLTSLQRKAYQKKLLGCSFLNFLGGDATRNLNMEKVRCSWYAIFNTFTLYSKSSEAIG